MHCALHICAALVLWTNRQYIQNLFNKHSLESWALVIGGQKTGLDGPWYQRLMNGIKSDKGNVKNLYINHVTYSKYVLNGGSDP